MGNETSVLIVLDSQPGLRRPISALLADFDWQVCVKYELSAALDLLEDKVVAMVLVDGSRDDAAALVAAIRQLPEPANGTPILIAGNDGVETAGAGGHLALPLDGEAFLALMRQWAGPLDDHALRSDPRHPRYRLIRLLGFANASAMLDRLRLALEEAVAGAEAAPAHRLAGLAGMLGYGELGALWSRVEAGEPGALDAAVAASRAAAEEIGRTITAAPSA